MLALIGLVSALLPAQFPSGPSSENCIECHRRVTPGVVNDWTLSKHSVKDVGCATCHGTAHQNEKDFANVAIPTPSTCAKCHEAHVNEFRAGKHAQAWAAMKAMPTIHYQPMELIEGMKGCGGCHKIGLKTDAEIKQLRAEGQNFGMASCDACHTRHTFSVAEARSPEACQTCHMPDGDHGVKTAWGFLGVRLPMPEDKEWAADRTTILEALGVLDVSGKPTARLEVMKAADVVRLTQQAWQDQRDKMVEVCDNCHAASYVKEELHNGDQLIRDADKLMAEAIRIIAALYKDGVLKKPKGATAAFPDLLTFHDAPTVIEQTLFVMFLEHRMRTYEGSFHQNPDYALWYGWSEMQRDLTEIRELAATMRRDAKKR